MTAQSDSSSTAKAAGGGLRSSLQGLAATLLAIFQTRLALLSTELEEEKQRLLATMAWGAVAVLLAGFAVAFAAMFLVVVFWDTHRVLVMALVTVFFGLGATLAVRQAARLLRQSSSMLSATLAELDADREALTRLARSSSAAAASGAQSPSPSSEKRAT